ncbi:hypothetical protein BHUM_03120 [Candidatus Burkholderia humilis]|nr:hypothetical protein BHUM_03120 [Candidatus Burkholderia humilis]
MLRSNSTRDASNLSVHNDAFREYDYIGARWLNGKESADVGNGGFSPRSGRLLEALADNRFEVDANAYEDALIGDAWRPVLESDYGIRSRPHGVFNMWRHIEDQTMLKIVSALDIATLAFPRGVALLKNYCGLRKFECMKAIYQRYRQHWTTQDVAQRCRDICEVALIR